ncbi:gliding motility protein GldN [Lishizhenia sp.]|uniref:type IX secretion system ring protein PorN/GldN n=1 Tax=Lishizhenia sp. TaxID=2497594 RepID=UPI00299DB65E|nr:gliding motility protein GldN [Lishizhenia sp.]MDX1445868.1 gliding motility protein GldN [Lishizhenia sp.]
MKGLIVSVLSVLCLVGSVAAQVDAGPLHTRPETGIIDGVYIQTNIPTKRLIPYEYVREADVIWSKRVWRTIDLREKMNHTLYYPLDEFDSEGNWIRNASRWSLWTIIRTGILAGNLTVYSPYNPLLYTMRDGDQFKYPILPADGKNYYTDAKYRDEINLYLATLGEESDVPFTAVDGWDSVDAQGNLVYPDRDTNYYMSKDIVQYRLKEDWFLDKERSIMDVRIIGIAPVIFEKDNNGFITGKKELFWLYFPECRYVFNNYFVYNEHNDARWMSFDDLFWKRRFSSTIDKRSNAYDRDIEKYRVGVDALLESQKITEEIRNIEHDVWSF